MYSYAMPLYLQALSFLLPPPPRKTQPTIPARCHAATLMNNIAQLLSAQTSASPNTPVSPHLQQASEWAIRALAVASTAEKLYADSGSTPTPGSEEDEAAECRLVQVVARQNLGMLAEMAGDRQAARKHFALAEETSKAIGLRAGLVEAKKGMKRVSGTTP